jgi:hypothetical protein
MKLNQAETIVDVEKFLRVNKAACNFYWNRNRRLAMPYYNRIMKYEEIRKIHR